MEANPNLAIEQREAYEELLEQERQLYSDDLFGFNKHVLGYDQNQEGTQDRWTFINPDNKFVLFLAPRGGLKSTDISIGYPLQRLTKNRNLRISLINATLKNSADFLAAIKEHIQFNPRFRELYGHYITDEGADRWTTVSIKIKRDKIGIKEPTICALGMFGNIISPHNDLIIVDDPVTIEDMWSPGLREKKLTWFLSLFDILEPGGQLILIGTHWHHDDMYSFIQKNWKKRFPDWKLIVHKAIIDKSMEGYEDRIGEAYFPLKFPTEKLESLRAKKGDSLFLAQYFNDTTFLQGRTFKLEWLKTWTELPDDIVKTQGIDLAISESDRACFFCIATLGWSPSLSKLFLIDLFVDKIDFPAQQKKIKTEAIIQMPFQIRIESNNYQLAMAQSLLIDEGFKNLKDKIVSVKSTKNKVGRITTSLTPLFENGTLLVPEKVGLRKFEPQELSEPWEEFIKEYINFPYTKNDVLDAISIGIPSLEGEEDSSWESWS